MIGDIVTGLLLLAGSVFVVVGGIGLNRLPDFFTRLHAVSIPDTLGIGLISVALIIQAGFTLISVKLVFVLLFLLFTGPTATHALAKAALHGNLKPQAQTKKNDSPELNP